MPTQHPARKLLVLDLDETLIHATENPLSYDADFRIGPYHVYRRPHLDEFIASVTTAFDVGVWTASGESYAAQVTARIFPDSRLKFVWASRRCTVVRDWTTGDYMTSKNLNKLKRRGYALEHIIAIDDTPSKYARSYGNLITVEEFVGDRADRELPALARYLQTLAQVPNVRSLEKRRWRPLVGGMDSAGGA